MPAMNESDLDSGVLVDLTAAIVGAYVSNNSIQPEQLPELIGAVHKALKGLGSDAAIPVETAAREPAVPIKKSIQRDFIVCLEDGLRFKSLRRHLNTKYGMSPEQYRAKWSLPPDYPMTAPSYSEARSALAKQSGLGQRRPAAKDRGSRKAAAVA